MCWRSAADIINKEQGGEKMPTQFYSAVGPVVEGWGLLNSEDGTTLPVFYKTRKDARSAKLQDASVVRVAMFAVAGE